MDTTTATIQYDDFAKVQLRTATVLECKAHPNADKLLVLQVDVGSDKRQICAGLRQHSQPEQLVGKQDPTQFELLLEELEITSIAA